MGNEVKQAEDAKKGHLIKDNAYEVARFLGETTTEENHRYDQFSDKDIRINCDYRSGLSANSSSDLSQTSIFYKGERVFIFPPFEDGDLSSVIDGWYIPGEWETKLDDLLALSNKAKNRRIQDLEEATHSLIHKLTN